MSFNQHYGGVIWTNHAIERLLQRGLSQGSALQAFQKPDKTERGGQNGATIFTKKVDNSLITIIAKQNERREWIILSTWIDPPLPGSKDAKEQASYRKYHNATGWKKIWLGIVRQLGL